MSGVWYMCFGGDNSDITGTLQASGKKRMSKGQSCSSMITLLLENKSVHNRAKIVPKLDL